MPTGTIDSAIFRDIFGTEAMRQVWSDGNRIQKYLDFEAAWRARRPARHHPAGGLRRNPQALQVDQFDIEKLKKQTERIGYPVLPVVAQLVGLCKGGLGEWCHWGATTQDITDTATIMQIRESLAIIEKDINAISDALAALAKKYRDTPMAGRSNLQQAVPITFGYKIATYLAAFERHKERLRQLRDACWCSSSAARPARCRRSARTGCGRRSSWRRSSTSAAGDRLAHRARPHRRGRLLPRPRHRHCGKIAFDVKLMMQTEVEEVFEPFHEGRGSSTTMPQKRNPISSVYITAQTSWCAARGGAARRYGAGPRARDRPWEIEWIALPEIFLLSPAAWRRPSS